MVYEELKALTAGAGEYAKDTGRSSLSAGQISVMGAASKLAASVVTYPSQVSCIMYTSFCLGSSVGFAMDMMLAACKIQHAQNVILVLCRHMSLLRSHMAYKSIWLCTKCPLTCRLYGPDCNKGRRKIGQCNTGMALPPSDSFYIVKVLGACIRASSPMCCASCPSQPSPSLCTRKSCSCLKQSCSAALNSPGAIDL